MKILILAEHYLPRLAGTVTHVENLSIALAQRGNKIILIVPNEQEATGLHIHEDHYGRILIRIPVSILNENCIDAGSREGFIRACRNNMPEWVSTYQPDIIHVMYGHYVYNALSNNWNAPLIWTCHNVPPQEYKMPCNENTATGRMLNHIYRIAVHTKHKRLIRSYPYDRIIAVSEATATLLRDGVGLLPQRVVVVPNGVRCISETQQLSGLPIDSSPIELLTVGGIKQHKGIHHLPYVAQKLVNMGVNFRWSVVGPSDNPKYAKEVRRQIEAIGLSDRIRWEGSISENQLDYKYRNAHVYVHMASQEGFCLTVLEALATGVPVVGTRVGAIPEMIHYGSGVLVEPCPESIADGINAVIRDYTCFMKGRDLADTIQSRYGWEAIAEKTEAVYVSTRKDIYE